jgi:ABC-type phosphate transport system substrate-binding protein
MDQSQVARIGGRSLWAVLIAGIVGSLGLASIGASNASAAIECTGSSIVGGGSSWQKIAQQSVWTPAFNSEICKSGPTVTYDTTGSGLEMWNAYGTRSSLNLERPFVGTDEAPTSAQIATMRGVAGGAHILVIPVAQTTLAIVANPPAGCTLENITNPDLEKTFRGRILNWTELGTDSGTCNSPMTRVVRKDGSGITKQLKNYLYLANEKGLPCTTGSTEGKASWQELEPVSNPESGGPSTKWPKSCEGTTLSTVAKPSAGGGGEVVKKVNATAGSIGYASLPDAKANSAKVILNLGNNGQKPASEQVYGSPVDPIKAGTPNCGSTTYVVPEEARKLGTGLDVDWSSIFGANPSIGGTAYPICMLTFVLALQGYGSAGFSMESEVTTHDYIRDYQVVKGQEDLDASATFYESLPTTSKSSNDVLGAAKYAGGKISY